MKKAFRYLLLIVSVLVVAICGFASFVAVRGIPKYKPQNVSLAISATPVRIAKGQKLASMLCSSCHLDPKTGKFTGRQMAEAPQFGTVYSRNITQDPVHGIGKWTDGQLVYLLRTGIKPDGTFLPVMAKLSHMSDEDINSIIAFLHSDHPWIQADTTQHPASEYSFLAKFITTIGAVKPGEFPTNVIAGPDTTDKVQWGRYIALNQVECYSCHSKDFTKNDYSVPEKSAGFFGGGNKMMDPAGHEIYTANITSDKETGIGNWSESDFVKAVKYGQVPSGRHLRIPMAPYANLSDNEARAIYAYLKTVPKINNKVDRKL